MQDFRRKVAVVTGGGSGIGRALVLAFAREGANVVVSDIDATDAESVRGEAKALGVRAVAVRADVAQRVEVDALAEAAYGEFGAVHILCNNAGVSRYVPFVELADSDWQWMLGVNLQGVVYGVQAFVPRMRTRSAGQPAHIVNTASIAGLTTQGLGRFAQYAATKYAVVGLSEALRELLRDEGIGVTVICPAGVETRFTDSGRNRPAQFGGPIPPEQPRDVAGGRMDPAPLADMVLHAIREERLYVVTHHEWRPMVEERFTEILAAFDAVPTTAAT